MLRLGSGGLVAASGLRGEAEVTLERNPPLRAGVSLGGLRRKRGREVSLPPLEKRGVRFQAVFQILDPDAKRG